MACFLSVNSQIEMSLQLPPVIVYVKSVTKIFQPLKQQWHKLYCRYGGG